MSLPLVSPSNDIFELRRSPALVIHTDREMSGGGNVVVMMPMDHVYGRPEARLVGIVDEEEAAIPDGQMGILLDRREDTAIAD